MPTLQEVLDLQKQADDAKVALTQQMFAAIPERLRPLLRERMGFEDLGGQLWFGELVNEGIPPVMGVSLAQARRLGWNSFKDLETDLYGLDTAWAGIVRVDWVRVKSPESVKRGHMTVYFGIV